VRSRVGGKGVPFKTKQKLRFARKKRGRSGFHKEEVSTRPDNKAKR